MQYLFDKWGRISGALRKAKGVFIFLDYDGTLTPIKTTPDKATLSKNTRILLRKISSLPLCKMAVISGRSLKDVRHKVGVEGIIYAGNHGLELSGQCHSIAHINHKLRGVDKLIQKLYSKLKMVLSKNKGVIIENKGLCLSIHYRLVKSHLQVENIYNVCFGEILQPLFANKVKLIYGKKVFEIRPRIDWDKGDVVKWLMSKQNGKYLPIYVGDDITDEDAFRVLKRRGLSIFVGRPKPSCALYFLNNHYDVIKFLTRIYIIRK